MLNSSQIWLEKRGLIRSVQRNWILFLSIPNVFKAFCFDRGFFSANSITLRICWRFTRWNWLQYRCEGIGETRTIWYPWRSSLAYWLLENSQWWYELKVITSVICLPWLLHCISKLSGLEPWNVFPNKRWWIGLLTRPIALWCLGN